MQDAWVLLDFEWRNLKNSLSHDHRYSAPPPLPAQPPSAPLCPPAQTQRRRQTQSSDRKAKLLASQSLLRVDAAEFVPTPALARLNLAPPPPAAAAGPRGPGSNYSSASSVCSGTDSEHELLEDDEGVEDGHTLSQNYLYHRYVVVLEKAMAERALMGPGNSPLVRSLYPFWVSRLTHKFNRNMYRTFVRLALEDGAVGDHVGMSAALCAHGGGLWPLPVSWC